MRNKLYLTLAAAFLLSSVVVAPAALAQPSPAQMKKAG